MSSSSCKKRAAETHVSDEEPASKEPKRVFTESGLSRLLSDIDSLDVEALLLTASRDRCGNVLAGSAYSNVDSNALKLYQTKLSQLSNVIGKLERQVAAEESINNLVLSVEVFRAVARSGFLTSNELGRLLLRSCKAFAGSMGREFIFRLLLKGRNDLEVLSPQVKEARPSHEDVFQALASPPDCKINLKQVVTWPDTISEPRLNADNIKLVLTVMKNGKQIASEVIPPVIYGPFGRYGRIEWTDGSTHFPPHLAHCIQSCLEEESRMTGNADNGALSNAQLESLFGKNKRLLSVRIQCIRLDTNKVCTLYDTSTAFIANDCLSFPGRQGLPLQRPLNMTEKGYTLLAKYLLSKSVKVRRVAGLSFRMYIKKRLDGSVLGVDIRAAVFKANGSESTLGVKNGVGLYHLLEELRGWK